MLTLVCQPVAFYARPRARLSVQAEAAAPASASQAFTEMQLSTLIVRHALPVNFGLIQELLIAYNAQDT